MNYIVSRLPIRNVFTIAARTSSSSAGNRGGATGEARESKELVHAMEDVPEEEYLIHGLEPTRLVPEVPIQSLELERNITKVSKKGSFTVDLFAGRYDHDFLTYPEPLENRQENIKLKDQMTMVKQLWPQIWDDERQLQKFNFFNLFQLSVTEMMTVFEAIGSSSRKCMEMDVPSLVGEDPGISQQYLVTKSIISLINRNCLAYWPISKSENYNVKQFIPRKHIIDGGSQQIKEIHQPVGFCWTEHIDSLGSLPPQEWMTSGQLGEPDVSHHMIQGKKTRVLYDPRTEYYALYFRDKKLSEQYAVDDYPAEEANPASDPFVGASLVHKSELKHSPVYSDSAGIKYTDVEIDTVIPNERLIFPAARSDPRGVNIKALGQMASCSVVLGSLKDALRRTYKHLIENKSGLLDCDIVEKKMTRVTSKIFAIESMVYYIAGMFDGLEDGFDAHMEAIILKIVTNEYAYECLRDLQQISGADMFITSRIQDQINIFDSFLDGNIHNRLYLSTMGIIWFARSQNKHLNQLRLAPWYPGYYFKNMAKEAAERNDFLTLDADIYGNLHPSLREAAETLEYILKRVKFAADILCTRYGKDITRAQSALDDLSQLSVDSFLLTTICARASKSYCNGARHSEIDIALAIHFSRELAHRVKSYIHSIQHSDHLLLYNRSKLINELNLKNGGYYPESPLDPNI